jgi:demethylmenaquinone methyltransferase/2-methoxy-6-polyprenyl-1,4-benzoquinol methylase
MNGQEELERRFFEPSEDELSPADRLIKATALWYRGEFDDFQRLLRPSREALYSEECNQAMTESLNRTVELIKKEQGLVLDLATGMGGLLEELLSSTEKEYLSVDISPSSSFGLLQYLRYIGWRERVVQIIADAANLPLKDDSIDVIVSAAGFQNMQDSKKVFKEVRRVSKKLIALCIFFEDDDPNLAHVSDRGLEEAGWNSRVENSVRAGAEPTPQSEILGVRPNMLPITSTTIEFTTVIAK